MKPKNIIHLLSGGLDSVTMLYDLKNQGHSVHCLLFDYRQQHVQELNFAKLHCHRLGVMFDTQELPPLGGLTEESRWVVPVRNLVMISSAASFAVKTGSEVITIGCNKDDEAAFPDCRMAFFQLVNTTLTTIECQVEVLTPYIEKSKAWIGGLARELGVPSHEIWSCYRGGVKPCGECPACIKLAAAQL